VRRHVDPWIRAAGEMEVGSLQRDLIGDWWTELCKCTRTCISILVDACGPKLGLTSRAGSRLSKARRHAGHLDCRNAIRHDDGIAGTRPDLNAGSTSGCICAATKQQIGGARSGNVQMRFAKRNIYTALRCRSCKPQ
jgi:hypothetical protein